MENETIEGIVGSIIYRNDVNGYTVMELECDDELVIAVCNAPLLGEGEKVKLVGHWTEHRDYGTQFKAISCTPVLPETKEQLERFLSSGLIKGCGPVTAHAIVDYFGDEVSFVLEYQPHRLVEVPGIGEKTAAKIAESFNENLHMRSVISGLGQYGITVSQALKIAAEYGRDALAKVKENPYRLAEDIFGIGFKTADKIAQSMGVSKDSPFRIASAIKYFLEWSGNEGHMFVPSAVLIKHTAKGIGVPESEVEKQLAKMIVSGEAVLGKGEIEPVYLPAFYNAERESARKLITICSEEVPKPEIDITETIDYCQKLWNINLAPMQIKALRQAVSGAAAVITGGPGTGKTTIIKFLIYFFERNGIAYSLCAPTGRAAKRMSEATQRSASTIHRLLEYSIGEDGRPAFLRNEQRPIEAGAIIIDEMSMVDAFLFHRLLKATKPGTRLIMIGDSDQLPSVGPGNILWDIIESDIVASIKLNYVYRQGEGSTISINAHKINKGECDLIKEAGVFEIIERNGQAAIWEAVAEQCTGPDIQIITPMKKGEVGVHGLNQKLQQLFNPKNPFKPELALKDRVFRSGDKVMQTRNNYRMEWVKDTRSNVEEGIGVFNGELGIITDIDSHIREARVLFDDDRMANYDIGTLEELELAYAITIHKSQGSEFDDVIIVLPRGPGILFTRNLLYTAVTRAKKSVKIIGSRFTIEQMIKNYRALVRYSGFKAALIEQNRSD